MSVVQAPPIVDVMEALADQLRERLPATGELDGLQVEPLAVANPTPPAIDIYPADPFMEQSAMGYRSQEAIFVVRLRVSSADQQAAQRLALSLMDVNSDVSVTAALWSDLTLGGAVSDLHIESVSGFQWYVEANGGGGLLGAEWRVRTVLL